MRLPGPDGKIDDWNRSALEAATIATGKWVRVAANMALGAYDVFEATGEIPPPTWPGTSFCDLLALAFKGRLVDSVDHPVLRRLRGVPVSFADYQSAKLRSVRPAPTNTQTPRGYKTAAGKDPGAVVGGRPTLSVALSGDALATHPAATLAKIVQSLAVLHPQYAVGGSSRLRLGAQRPWFKNDPNARFRPLRLPTSIAAQGLEPRTRGL